MGRLLVHRLFSVVYRAVIDGRLDGVRRKNEFLSLGREASRDKTVELPNHVPWAFKQSLGNVFLVQG